MPLPRYQPIKKKQKLNHEPSLDDLDDFCLSKIIGYVLTFASIKDDNQLCDNRRTEKNLSLVSKRWYFLTQAQVAFCGFCRIDLDNLLKNRQSLEQNESQFKRSCSNLSLLREPKVLVARNNNVTCKKPVVQSVNGGNVPILGSTSEYDIDLFRSVIKKFRKYKKIQLDGSLSCEDFRKLIVCLSTNQVEQLVLNVSIRKDKTSVKNFSIIPKQLSHLERLTLRWSNNEECQLSNALTWTVYLRACNLRSIEIYLDETEISNNKGNWKQTSNTIQDIANKYLDKSSQLDHVYLKKLIFDRIRGGTLQQDNDTTDCEYTSLMKNVISSEVNLSSVNTNDKSLIDFLVVCSERTCTRKDLKYIRLSSELSDLDLLGKLLTNRSLGSDYLSLTLSNMDQLDDVKLKLEEFHLNRDQYSTCHLSFHIKDQKFSDVESKIKNLVYISRMAQVTINIKCQQRVSIDCCHLMWSIGRSLQSISTNGTDQKELAANCLFKITIQTNAAKASVCSELTIPFGRCHHFRVNPTREDLVRHREVMRSLKRDCYNQFVKSVRDNITP